MSHLKTQYLLFIICKCLTIITSLTNNAPQSPCPDVFQYEYDNGNNLYGFIQVPTPNSYQNVILLEVQISVGNTVQGSSGNIALISARSHIIEDLLQKKPIHYRLDFPYWFNVPPRITKISVNGHQICFGYPVDRNIVPVITTINLQHTLTISVPLSTGPKVNNEGSSLPDSPFIENVGTRDGTYPYIPDSKPANAVFNFNPQQPMDPNKVYGLNPFANQNNIFRPETSTFYQKFNPSAYNPITESFKPQNYPGWFRPNNGNNMFPNSGYPQFNPQFNYQDVPSTRPQNQLPSVAATVKPNIETNLRPTQLPKEPDVEDLPTVESNLLKKPFSGVCGISVNSNALLINANRVPKGLHPWLVALFRQDDEGLKFICGSTLISQKHLVTAAHCVQGRLKKTKPENLWAVLGRENIQRWSNDGAQIVQAESTHVHPDFQVNTADADIAVIILSEEAVFSTLVKPICLWTGEQNQKLIVEKKGTVVGWGKDQTGKVSTPEPRQLSFPVVSEEDCLRSNIGFREITSNRTFCAGYRNNSGPCNGDSGSGFLMQKSGRWTLRGVVSTSLRGPDGGCDLKQYIVFTDAALFTEWLMSFLN